MQNKLTKIFLKLELLNIRSLTPKVVIVNKMITDNSFDVLCLTETWLKSNDLMMLVRYQESVK